MPTRRYEKQARYCTSMGYLGAAAPKPVFATFCLAAKGGRARRRETSPPFRQVLPPPTAAALSGAESAGPEAGGRLESAKAAERPVEWPGRSLSVRKNAYIPRKTSEAFSAGRGGTVERAYFRRQAETSDAELVPTRTGRGPFSFLKRKWGAEPFPCGQGTPPFAWRQIPVPPPPGGNGGNSPALFTNCS